VTLTFFHFAFSTARWLPIEISWLGFVCRNDMREALKSKINGDVQAEADLWQASVKIPSLHGIVHGSTYIPQRARTG